jgi:hypothetical protein
MAAKKKKSKSPNRAKPAPKKLAHKSLPRASKKAAKKAPVARPASGAFADQVRSGNPGTGLWFSVAHGIEHAVIRKRGGDGTILALTDAGAEAVLLLENVFETAAEARAHGRIW